MADTYTTIGPEDLLPDDILIAIMGPRSSGKDRILDTVVRGVQGEVLPLSPLPAIRIYIFTPAGVKSQRLVLVHFPDFYDNDVIVLKLINDWLKATYERGLKLTGILYTHRISGTIQDLSNLKDLFIFGELCGDRALTRTIIVTTMWNEVDEREGESHERTMREVYWKGMLECGCKVVRFDNTFRSITDILDGLIDSGGEKETLLVQEELVNLGMLWNETRAGRMLYASWRAALDKYEAELEQTQRGIRAAIIRGRIQHSIMIMKELEIPPERHSILQSAEEGKLRGVFSGQTAIAQQNRLRTLVSRAVNDCDRESLFGNLVGDEAQLVADYLNSVLYQSGLLGSSDTKQILACLCALARGANVYPRCYKLKGIQKESNPRAIGGFSEVFRGTYENQTICIKVIRKNQQTNRNHALIEISLWAHLWHQNILPFYGVYFLDEGEDQMCLVSPWIQNGNLDDYLDEYPEVPRMPLVLDVIEGVLYLHQTDIVHGDLKSVNVLVSAEGRAMIADFGISRVATTNTTQSDSPNGTTRWQARELHFHPGERKARVTTQSDIWSLGCLCYKILSGRAPFYQYSGDGEFYLALYSGKTPTRPETGADHNRIDDIMWGLLQKCWSHVPEGRPSCAAVRDFVVSINIEDNRLQAPGLSSNNFVIWEAMRAKSDVGLDYDRIDRILRRIQPNRLHE